MHPPLLDYLASLTPDLSAIPPARKPLLGELAAYVRRRLDLGTPVRLHFICTHNSRRSHLAQIWAAVAAAHTGLRGIETYSAGTEATAFNPRAVAALQRAGFRITTITSNEPDLETSDPPIPSPPNPIYKVEFAPEIPPLLCFSKALNHPDNPPRDFAAVMTCSDADANCPILPGADVRISLPYRDPKESDGTPEEAQTYDQRSRQIAAEMLFAMRTAAGLEPVMPE